MKIQQIVNIRNYKYCQIFYQNTNKYLKLVYSVPKYSNIFKSFKTFLN